MLHCQFLCHVLKALVFTKIALKLSYFCKKMQNFRALGAPPPYPQASGGWELCPQTPSLQRLGVLSPDPQWPPAAGSFTPTQKNSPPLRISGYAPGRHYGGQRGSILFLKHHLTIRNTDNDGKRNNCVQA